MHFSVTVHLLKETYYMFVFLLWSILVYSVLIFYFNINAEMETYYRWWIAKLYWKYCQCLNFTFCYLALVIRSFISNSLNLLNGQFRWFSYLISAFKRYICQLRVVTKPLCITASIFKCGFRVYRAFGCYCFYHVYSWWSLKSEQDTGFLEIGVSNSCELSCSG